jgi:hypothetical protein
MSNRSSIYLRILLFAIFFIADQSNTALAQSTYFVEGNKTVRLLGAQGVSFYVNFGESGGQNCLYGMVYITPDRKGLYTQLLAAKLTARRINRFDYSQPAGNGTQCFVELVELAD